MGNYENIVKIEEMRRKIDEGDYLSAQKILDTMDRKKIKNLADLSLMAEVYALNERYGEAMELLLKIYEKSKTRKTLFQIIEVCINNRNIEEAEKYLLIYEVIAPKDFYKYIFRYQINKLKNEPYEKLIETLVTLKNTEYIEQWAYELAKLYYKAGMEEECIKECSDIILWFGEGIYVEKAKMLKAYYSGETNKEKMIEELKRRAALEKNPELNSSGEEETEEYIEQEENLEDSFSASEECYFEEEASTAEKISLEEKTSISEEISLEEKTSISEEISLKEEASMGITMDLKKDVEDILLKEQTNYWDKPEEISDKELAEQEVEETIYQLLEEEDLNEEDKKIKEFSSILGFNIEEIFLNFLHVKAVKKQLVKSLEGIFDEHTKSIQMIITGTEKRGKTTLAKDLTLFFNKIGKLKTTKVAKINAVKMNGIDLLSKKETLRDCCLIVENASELKHKTIEDLLELIYYYKGDIIVIFEENKKNMNKLFRECPKLMDIFKNRIHLPQYTPEDLLGMAEVSFQQHDYLLSPEAQTLLQNKIYQIAKQIEPSNQLDKIQELVASIKAATDIRIGKEISTLAESGRLQDSENRYVHPEDFTH